MALAMVFAGARGETEQQMAETLSFTLPQDRLQAAFNVLDMDLASRSDTVTWDELGEEVEIHTFKLTIANAVWGQAGYTFVPGYLDLLAQNYGAGVRLADFRANAPAAVDAINRWVSEQTEGRIREALRELPTHTRLVLANAIYFNAQWDLPFDEEDTTEEPFYLLAGGEQLAPMMHQRDWFPYTEGDGYQAIQLPYLYREVATVILLPGDGRFHEIEERLTGHQVEAVLMMLAQKKVILTMPKFRYETPVISLREALLAMGMPDAFSPDDADFTAMSEQADQPIYIGDVVHKALIDVDERGTEAAAATIVDPVAIAPPDQPTEPPPIVMEIDRPFIFLIRDLKSNTILFVGRVMNPASE